jgi:hypothetical protein
VRSLEKRLAQLCRHFAAEVRPCLLQAHWCLALHLTPALKASAPSPYLLPLVSDVCMHVDLCVQVVRGFGGSEEAALAYRTTDHAPGTAPSPPSTVPEPVKAESVRLLCDTSNVTNWEVAVGEPEAGYAPLWTSLTAAAPAEGEGEQSSSDGTPPMGAGATVVVTSELLRRVLGPVVHRSPG